MVSRVVVLTGSLMSMRMPPRWLAIPGAVASALLAGAALLSTPGAAAPGGADGARAGRGAATGATPDRQAAVARAYAKLPLRFEQNRGQTDPRVRFLARGAGYTMFLTPREAVLSLTGGERSGSAGAASRRGASSARGAVVRLRLLGGARNPRVEGVGRLPGVSNYLRARDRGGPHKGVPGYSRVRYRGVYPGVDLDFYGRQGRLEYDFRVAPRADPRAIGFSVTGARGLELDRAGNLVISTAAGRVRQLRPVVYQRIAGRRRAVAGRYVLKGGGRVGFALGSYDRRRALVIDPVLTYSTYLGGSTGRNVGVVAADASGAAYVGGETSAIDFPTTAFDRTRGGDPSDSFSADAFVAKLNPAGDALVYSTYLGGNETDAALGIAVDAAGRAYLTGGTNSSDFPTTAGAFQPLAPYLLTSPSSSSAFVSVLKADGSGLVYSSFLGGSTPRDPDSLAFGGGESITVDASGRAYVTGFTTANNFPTKAPPGETPFQASPRDTVSQDGFVAKLDPGALGSASLIYSSYLGGDGNDTGLGIAVDAGGNAYVAGRTLSTDFPTKNALRGTLGGDEDGFVAKLNATGSALAYSTYLGGTALDSAKAIALDASGHAYVTGSTESRDFPTASAFQPSHAGGPAVEFINDAFVTKLAPDGQSLSYSSYLGGVGDDVGAAIAVTPSGSAYVAGSADSTQEGAVPGSFPTVDPVAPFAAEGDAFVSAVKPDGSGLSFSTYLGGGGGDQVFGLALDPSGNVYVAGEAVSTDFPTRNAFQATSSSLGVGDRRQAFVAKLAPVDPAAPLVTGLARRSGPEGTSLVISGHGFTGASAVRFGDAAASSFTVDSDGQITAIAPAHAPGPAAVTVTTGQGTSPANPIATFTYAQGAWDLTGSLIVGRSEGQTATLLSNGKVLVAGGTDSSGAARTASAELYDPASGTWTATGPLAQARFGHTATLLSDGKVLVAGGCCNPDGSGMLASAELYDPASGTWAATRPMARARSGHTATLLSNGKVLVAGGTGADFRSTASAELYDPASGEWAPAASMTGARANETATLLSSGKVLVAGGTNEFRRSTRSAELYDPASDSWATTGSLGDPRSFHTATLLADGRVLVAGGADGLRPLDSAQVYDPASDDFGAPSTMRRRRAGPAAALLADGRVLVTGGSELSSFHDTAELYDPASDRWGSAGVMNRYRGAFGGRLVFAVPLASGKVLVGGDSRSAGDTAELYDPAPPGAPAPGPVPVPVPVPGSGGEAPPPGPGVEGPGPGLGGGLASPPDTTAPVVGGYRVTNRRFAVARRPTPRLGSAAAKAKKGTTFTYTLSEPATVTIAIAQRQSGRRRGRKCIAPSKKLGKARKCTRIVKKGALKRTSRQGANRVAFTGRIASRALKPGSYQATLTATDAAKNASKPKTVKFTVVRR